MDIVQHICSLLYEHDCVILPGFGAFICNYSPAYIDKERNLFHPPFKKISFNRNLKNNDGLLANHIAQAEGISFTKATQHISEFVSRLNEELKESNRAELKNIGWFLQGKENTLHFEQDETVNYLPESTGFSIFYSPPVKREPVERKFERTLKNKVITAAKYEKNKSLRRGRAGKYLAVAASALILGSLISVSLFTGFLKNLNVAGFTPFTADAKALYHPPVNNFEKTEETKNNVNTLFAPAIDTARYMNIVINGSVPVVVRLKEEVKKENVPLSKTITTKRFHIIGGAFAIPENAEKFKRKLKKSGYDAIIIERKLHFVSYGNYATREQAIRALENIRTIQADAWLMSN